MKKIIIVIIVIATAVAAGLFLKSQKKVVAELPIAKEYTYKVATQRAETKSVREKRHFLAQLLASKSALIASKFSADIKKVYVKENDMVKKGQRLISLDDAEIMANVASLKQQKRALETDVKMRSVHLIVVKSSMKQRLSLKRSMIMLMLCIKTNLLQLRVPMRRLNSFMRS